MKKLVFKESNEVTKTIALVDYVKDQCTPAHDNDTFVMLAKYDMKTGEGKTFKLSIDFKPVTNITCFRQVVMSAYYAQVQERNNEHIASLKEKLDSGTLTVDQNLKASNDKKLAEEYAEELTAIMDYFSTPVSDFEDKSPKALADNSTIAQFVAGTISGSYPDVLELNEVVKTASEYYSLLQKDSTQSELKESYQTTRKALEVVCNKLSFDETCFSSQYNNHANQLLTKAVVVDIVSRYYKGRRIDSKTGKVARSVDTKGLTMRKEIILACLEKFHK